MSLSEELYADVLAEEEYEAEHWRRHWLLEEDLLMEEIEWYA